VLNAMDIEHLKERDVLTLSGGEQKRAQLARVLAQIWPSSFEHPQAFEGKWLFLDEWSDALDLKHQVHIGCLFKQLVQKGLGIIMVSHDLNQVLHLTDTCTLLKKGQLFAQGPTHKVMNDQTLTEVFDLSVQVVKTVQPNASTSPSVVVLKPFDSNSSD